MTPTPDWNRVYLRAHAAAALDLPGLATDAETDALLSLYAWRAGKWTRVGQYATLQEAADVAEDLRQMGKSVWVDGK